METSTRSLLFVLASACCLAGTVGAQTPARLLNIQFYTTASAPKNGPAAIGNEGDAWNRYSRDDGSGGFRTAGDLADLQWADGTASPVDLTITNAAGAWPSGIPDPLMATYLYPLPNGNGNIRFSLTQVPAGRYDLYLYGRGNADNLVGDFNVEAQYRDQGTRAVTVGPGWQATPLQESVHYVVFRGVPADGLSPITVTVRPSPHGEAVLNGLQLFQTDATPPPVP